MPEKARLSREQHSFPYKQEKKSKLVSIIILNWNGKRLLEECLNSLSSTAYPLFRVVVVDNGSTDGSVQMMRKRFQKVEVLELDRNVGFPRGNNIGIRYALTHHNPAYVFLMSNDMKVIDPNWLLKLVGFAETDNRIGITGTLLVAPDGRAQEVGLEFVPGVFLPFFRRAMSKVTIGCGLIKREVIEKVGLLDEDYQKVLFEDVDYMARARRAGYKVLLDSESVLLHYGSASVSKLPTLERFYLFRRNGARYIRKYHPLLFIPFVSISYLGCLVALGRVSRRRGSYFREALKMTTSALANGMM